MGQDNKVLERFARDYPAGTVLFREGEPGDEMYVIRAGKVRISKRVRNLETTLGVLMPGDFFGEMAILSNRPRSATASVIEQAHLIRISAQTFEAMLKSNTEIALRMIKKLADRLAEADRQIHTLLMSDHHSRVTSFFLHALDSLEGERGEVLATLEEIASQTGCDYAQVSDALEQLSRLGLVNPTGAGYVVRGRDALAGYLELLR